MEGQQTIASPAGTTGKDDMPHEEHVYLAQKVR